MEPSVLNSAIHVYINQVNRPPPFKEMQGAVESMQANRWLMAFSLVLGWLCFAAMESSPWQATLGKKVFRLRMMSVCADRLGPLRASLRHFAKVVLMDLSFMLSFLPAAFTARRQALHDFVAGTFVVREQETECHPTSPEPPWVLRSAHSVTPATSAGIC